MELSLTERVLQTYSLDEILEMNDLTESDLLDRLLEYDLIKLPDILPVDLET